MRIIEGLIGLSNISTVATNTKTEMTGLVLKSLSL